MNTDLRKHLRGVYSALRSRVELINASIGHASTQGGENEEEIRRLLLDFLPAKYGVGSGVIIDIEGNSSKQIDIVIYDNSRADYTLSRSSKLFLVDHVVATLEIKTTYSSTGLREALENIQSVKELQSSRTEWMELAPNLEHQSLDITKYRSSPPLGIVFFFRAQSPKQSLNIDSLLSTMKQRVDAMPTSSQPDLLFSLAHGLIFRHVDIGKRTEDTQEFAIFLAQEPRDRAIALELSGLQDSTRAILNFDTDLLQAGSVPDAVRLKLRGSKANLIAIPGDGGELEPYVYPVARIKGRLYPVDTFRAFLVFICAIERLLSMKKINPSWSISDYYGGDFFKVSVFDRDFG